MNRPSAFPRIAALASTLALAGSLGCQQEEPTIAAKDYPAAMAEGYCKAAFSCQCDDYPYESPNECFVELGTAYDELNDEAYLAGLRYDGSCPAQELDQIESYACKSWLPEAPANLCVPPCNVWHGTAAAGSLCEYVVSSAELGIAFSDCAQGLVCNAGVCVDPCQGGDNLPGVGEPCPDMVCEEGAMCDENLMCVAQPGLPGPGEPCMNGQCDADRAVCVVDANTCAALPSTGQDCIEGQCDRDSYCDVAEDACVARPALACFLLSGGGGGDGDGDGDPTGDGDGDPTGDGDGDPDALSHAVHMQPIWDANCTSGCHEPGGAAESSIDLSGDAYDDIVGVPSSQAVLNLIEPGSSSDSYLFHKLRGTQVDAGGLGAQMPSGGDVLPEDTLLLIAEWIQAGAPA